MGKFKQQPGVEIVVSEPEPCIMWSPAWFTVPAPYSWPDQMPDGGYLVPPTFAAEIQREITQRCPECNGTGKYIGLTVVEPCRCCGGRNV